MEKIYKMIEKRILEKRKKMELSRYINQERKTTGFMT